MFILGILSIQCKIRRDRPSDTRRSISRYDRPMATPSLFQRLTLHFLVRILNILPKVLYSQPLLKDSLNL